MTAIPMPPALRDNTAREAIIRTERATVPLTVPLGAFVGASYRDEWTATKFGRDVINAAARAQGGR